MRRAFTGATVAALLAGALLVAYHERGTTRRGTAPSAAPQIAPLARPAAAQESPVPMARQGGPRRGVVTPRNNAVGARTTTRDDAFFAASYGELVRVEEDALRAVAANDEELGRLLALSRASRARVETAAATAAERARQGTIDEQFPELDTADIDAEMKAILGDRYSEFVQLETSMAVEAMEAAVTK